MLPPLVLHVLMACPLPHPQGQVPVPVTVTSLAAKEKPRDDRLSLPTRTPVKPFLHPTLVRSLDAAYGARLSRRCRTRVADYCLLLFPALAAGCHFKEWQIPKRAYLQFGDTLFFKLSLFAQGYCYYKITFTPEKIPRMPPSVDFTSVPL